VRDADGPGQAMRRALAATPSGRDFGAKSAGRVSLYPGSRFDEDKSKGLVQGIRGVQGVQGIRRVLGGGGTGY